MSCRAEIFTQQEQRVAAIPVEAVIFEEDRAELRSEYFIFVNDDGMARKTKVEVGLSDDEYQELISNIDSDVEVIVGPNRELRNLVDGALINTKQSGSEAASQQRPDDFENSVIFSRFGN